MGSGLQLRLLLVMLPKKAIFSNVNIIVPLFSLATPVDNTEDNTE